MHVARPCIVAGGSCNLPRFAVPIKSIYVPLPKAKHAACQPRRQAGAAHDLSWTSNCLQHERKNALKFREGAKTRRHEAFAAARRGDHEQARKLRDEVTL